MNHANKRWKKRVYEKLYNSEVLEDAHGKTLVLTEGEFKAKIMDLFLKKHGMRACGFIGITEIGDEIYDALAECKADTILIMLDADPQNKRIPSHDSETASNRAALEIANELLKRLRQNGATTKVKIARLSDTAGYKKLGGDDLLCEEQNGEGIKEEKNQRGAGKLSSVMYMRLKDFFRGPSEMDKARYHRVIQTVIDFFYDRQRLKNEFFTTKARAVQGSAHKF